MSTISSTSRRSPEPGRDPSGHVEEADRVSAVYAVAVGGETDVGFHVTSEWVKFGNA